MGNKNEEMRIRNRHAERIAEIEAMKEEQERQAAIQRLALENGYKLDLKRIEMLAENARMEHERKLREIENNRQHNKNLTDNERKRDEMLDKRERDKQNKDYELRLKQLNDQASKDRMEDQRLTEEMRKK